MMNWFLIVFLSTTVNGLHEGFMWYEPNFESNQQCQEWANNNPATIIQSLNYYYDEWAIEKIYCVRKDRLGDLNMIPYPENTTET